MARLPLPVRLSVGAYRILLWLYPAAFTREFGGSMVETFREMAEDAVAHWGPPGVARIWCLVLWDVLKSAPEQHRAVGVRRLGGWSMVGLALCGPALAFWASVALGECLEVPLGRRLEEAQAGLPIAVQIGLLLGLPAGGLLVGLIAARSEGRSAASLAGVATNAVLVLFVLGAATLRIS
jgi:hypothetical protein